ncbi:MAG: hypothetical protein QOG72_3408 [Sphingomonadales bacterium]|jgi:hypothetical protein|nr:hypothetical protein [Sphingomonadales bacterium]
MTQRRALAYAWSALALGAFAWFAAQQLGSDLSFSDCDSNGALETGLVGLVALLVTGAGAWLSHRAWTLRNPEAEGRDFIAFVGMLTAGLLAIAIVYQTVAAFIIPSCFG